MEKSSKTGNQAVAGITPTATTKPTTSIPSASSSAKSSSSSSSRSSGSSGSSRSYATPVYVEPQPSYANNVYTAYANTGVSPQPTIDYARQAAAAQALVQAAQANLPKAEVQKIDRVAIDELIAELQGLADSQTQRALKQINTAVETGTTELNRAYEDALPQFQAQRNQIAADEARTLDNQVLYAARRGDSGGVGQSQYGSIQNTVATNQQTVNAAQIKLYTDTSRQIADLEAKGEFEKADKVLAISQEFTSRLMDLQKWAKEENVDIDQFNTKLDEWKADYDLSVARYLNDVQFDAAGATGVFADGTPTIGTLTDEADRYAQAGKAMMSAGIVPSETQLASMGWTPEQYWVYKMANYVQ